MNFSRSSKSLDPAQMRLPLIALIDVVLFLLLYFIFAGNISAEEAELSAALRSEKAAAGRGADLQPQIISVDLDNGRPVFRLGERVARTRSELTAVLKDLPKEGGVFIRVSGAVPVESAASAIQAAKDAGFVKVSYVPAK